MEDMFKAATVRSMDEFSRRTGRQMGETLQQQLGRPPSACWLFCAPLENLEELHQGIWESIGTDLLIGCTSDGEISSQGMSINSAVLGGIATDQFEFEIAAVPDLSRDSEQAGRELARSFSRKPQYIQIFSDGLTGNGCGILRGIAAVDASLTVSGGTAGDNGKFVKTLQFAGDKIYTDSVCGIAFYGNFRLGTGVRSGWSPIGLARKVTRASGNVLYELNGEPALNVFERFLGRHAEKLPAIGVEYPLGLLERWGDVGQEDYQLLRATMSVNRQERSITFAGEIPEGAVVNLTCGDIDSILEAAEKAAALARSELGDTSPALIFCYSCMARKIMLGRRSVEEIERMRTQIGPQVPILGFYSYGEFCRVTPWSPNYFHNETITLSVIGI